MQPTQRELAHIRESFTYSPKTGIVSWSLTCKFLRRIKPGAPAGTVVKGYVYIGVGGAPPKRRMCYAHQIAWFLMTGEWPLEGFEVDHKDRDGLNNRWKNLRLATSSQNKANSKIRIDNTSGSKGVAMDCQRNQWQVYIAFNKKRISLGRFAVKDLDKAIAARRAGELKYFGKYAPK
jgi:hypothetical protein